MRPATHGDDLDGAHDLGVDQRPYPQARHGHGVFRDEGEAQPGHRHALHPIVAVAAEDDARLAIVLAEDAAGMAEELALLAVDVGLVVQVGATYGILLVEGVPRPDADHEALVVEPSGMEAFVDLLGLAVDRDVELALR